MIVIHIYDIEKNYIFTISMNLVILVFFQMFFQRKRGKKKYLIVQLQREYFSNFGWIRTESIDIRTKVC
jgi:hypothetical protein